VELYLLRPKEQYLAASLTILECCKEIPQKDDPDFFLPTSKEQNESTLTFEAPFEGHCTRQLNISNA